jgi:hypothetical protein
MAFPTTPTNGQIATVNGITFSYSSSTNSWTRVSSALYNIANIVITSNANVGNLNAINNVTGSTGNFSGNVFAAGVVGTTYYGQINLGTTSVNLDRTSGSQILNGVGIGGTAATATVAINNQITANTNAGTAYITFVDKTSGNAGENATTSLTFNPATGNITAQGMFTATGVYWAGNGAAFASAPGGTTGQIQFNNASTFAGAAGLTYFPVSGNLYLSTNTQSTSVTTGALVIEGGLGLDSNLYIQGSAGNSIVATGNVNVRGNLVPFGWASGSGNIGSPGRAWNTVFAKATSAQYADLAENYIADSDYAPGTVLIFGGDKEVTVTELSHDTRVAGVVSTEPAYLMNSMNGNVPVALTGRVPCFVRGPIYKGSLLVTSDIPGVAEAMSTGLYRPGCVIGKSLEEIQTNEIQTIEVVVGRT